MAKKILRKPINIVAYGNNEIVDYVKAKTLSRHLQSEFGSQVTTNFVFAKNITDVKRLTQVPSKHSQVPFIIVNGIPVGGLNEFRSTIRALNIIPPEALYIS